MPGPINALANLVRSIVARAVVRAVKQDELELLQLEVSPGNLQSDVERVGHYGLASATLPGAIAVRLLVRGAPEHAVVVAVDDPRYRPTNLGAGDVQLYNQAGDHVWLKGSRALEASVNGAKITMDGATLKLELGAASITLTPASIALKAPAITLDP